MALDMGCAYSYQRNWSEQRVNIRKYYTYVCGHLLGKYQGIFSYVGIIGIPLAG